MPDSEISSILEALEYYHDNYEQEAVDAAVPHREEIVPYLIDCLERVADNPTRYLEDRRYYLYVFAVMLLGHWHETRGHAAIIRVFSLPGPVLDDLYGDLGTEHLPMILYNTCGGDFEPIKSLVSNPRADAFIRGSAARALTFGVASGELPREEVLDFFSTLFTGEEAGPQSAFWGEIADRILDLYPLELMPIIQEADTRGLLDSGLFLTEEDFSKALADGSVEQSLATIRREMALSSLDDLDRIMSPWSSPDDEELYSPLLIDSAAKKPKKATKKSKKKQAKASRRKNRR